MTLKSNVPWCRVKLQSWVLPVASLRHIEKLENETETTITKNPLVYQSTGIFEKERLERCTVENFGPGGSKNKVIKIK